MPNYFYSNPPMTSNSTTRLTNSDGNGSVERADSGRDPSTVPGTPHSLSTFWTRLQYAAKTSEPAGPGTRGLTLFAADKMRQTPSKKTDTWMCFDDYIVSYYPEDAFEPTRYEAKEGYEGSSKDHFYTNSGLHRLAARHLRCMCSSCMTKPELYSDSCSLSEWCGGVRHYYNLEAADMRSRGENVRPSSRILTLGQFRRYFGTYRHSLFSGRGLQGAR